MSEEKKVSFVSLAVKNAKDVKIEDAAKKRAALHKVRLAAKVSSLKGFIMEAEAEVEEKQDSLNEAIGNMYYSKTDEWLKNINEFEINLHEALNKLKEYEETKSYLEALIKKYF